MGERLYKIGLVICASNYERHRNIIQAVHRALTKKGPYALFVITNYGAYYDGRDFQHGEPADYSLLDHIELDGCILEANLGSEAPPLCPMRKGDFVSPDSVHRAIQRMPSVPALTASAPAPSPPGHPRCR